MKSTDDSRRGFLVSALSAGLYSVGAMGILQPVWAMGKIPKQLESGKSIYDLSGDSSHLIFAVGKDAFILRSNGVIKVEGSGIVSQVRLISGKLLSVFGKRSEKQRLSLNTSTATIGIRGTGIYLEAEPEQTYICICYGAAHINAIDDIKSVERVVSNHHDASRFVLADQPAGQNIQPAPVFNHTDDELALIETLVGRAVPFARGGYSSPRRTNY